MLTDKLLIFQRSSSSKQPTLNVRFIYTGNMARLHCKARWLLLLIKLLSLLVQKTHSN